MLSPTVGRVLDGATLAECDDCGGVGMPAWGPAALLRDLELRLGLPEMNVSRVLRLQRWSIRLEVVLPQEPFYARSYRDDPLGTATVLLHWRDDLIDGGWDGCVIPAAGPRLKAFADVEAVTTPVMLPGDPERLRSVEQALGSTTQVMYSSVTLADSEGAWPQRWQRVFQLLQQAGTVIGGASPSFAGAELETDLGRLQQLIRTNATAATAVAPRGDGSLLLLRAPTTVHAADAVAALVRASTSPAVVVRGGEPLLLDDALARQSLAALGTAPCQRWRAPLQLLSLALELLFEPADPYRALELLTLPMGPFRGITQHMMSQAISDAPGIGGRRWHSAKARLREYLVAQGEDGDGAIALVDEWLESPRHDPIEGAPRASVLATVHRVREHLRVRLAVSEEAGPMSAAYEQCCELVEIVESSANERLDRLAVRQLVDMVTVTGTSADIQCEQAGRIDHVEQPGSLLCARDEVIWWHFVAPTARLPTYRPWRRDELSALRDAGVVPAEPVALLTQDSLDCRRAVLAARKRLILVAPENVAGEAMTPHPFWDEIVARLRVEPSQLTKIVVSSETLLDRRSLPVEELAGLPLPEARPAWQIAPGMITFPARQNPAAIEHLLECPLRWVLGVAAGVRHAPFASVPEGPLLNGQLGHSLIQALFESGALHDPSDIKERATVALDDLVAREAAPLLQPGMRFELFQLRAQLVHAVASLHELIHRARLVPVSVEEELTTSWLGGEIAGRLDLRLRCDGQDRILDLKWGRSTYQARLAEGRAVQLAAYVYAIGATAGAYFSLSRGTLLTTEPEAFASSDGIEGPSSAETSSRIASTVPEIQQVLATGTIPVTGVRRSLPLLESLAIPEADRGGHFQCESGRGCDYCGFQPLCGRAWEELA